MSQTQGGTVSPMVFLLVCVAIALVMGLITLVRFLLRPKCADCGLRMAEWSYPGGFARMNFQTMKLMPLCKSCFTKHTVKMNPPKWVPKAK